MLIYQDPETILNVLPQEVLYQVIFPELRRLYLQQLGAPRGEFSIADYITEKGQPPITNGELDFRDKGLTSLIGIEGIH